MVGVCSCWFSFPFQTDADTLAKVWCWSFSAYSCLATLLAFLKVVLDSSNLSLPPLLNASSFWHLNCHRGSWWHTAVTTEADVWYHSFCVLIQTIGGSPENIPLSADKHVSTPLLFHCSTSSHSSPQVYLVLVSVCMRGWDEPSCDQNGMIGFLNSDVTVIKSSLFLGLALNYFT